MDTTRNTNRLLSLIIFGAIAGIIAGVVMAMYAMIASATFLGQGFFTPLYGIASPLIGPQAMMTSMKQGVFFAPVPALLGLVIHMLWATLYGIIFGLIARGLQLKGALAVMGGLGYSLLVLLFMSFIVLPIVRAGQMPTIVGWPSFLVQHLFFGVTLGLWPVLQPQMFINTLRRQVRPAA